MASPSLRDQHAAVTRTRILSAVGELLEEGDAEELTMPAVAAASDVSLRTIYRYYPTREELLEAAGRWIGDELLGHPYPATLDEVADRFEEGAPDFDEHPGLVRAMALSQLGRRIRGYRRRAARGPRTSAAGRAPPACRRTSFGAPRQSSRLHNILAYTTLREENGLSGEEIGRAIGWRSGRWSRTCAAIRASKGGKNMPEQVIVRGPGEGRTLLVGGGDLVTYKVRSGETDGAYFCRPSPTSIRCWRRPASSSPTWCA
jgi:AcrR family transcriptional regulator